MSQQTTKDWLRSEEARAIVSAKLGTLMGHSGQWAPVPEAICRELADALPETREPVVVTEEEVAQLREIVDELKARRSFGLGVTQRDQEAIRAGQSRRIDFLSSLADRLALDSTSQSPVPDGPQYPPAERLIESLRWAVGYIDRLKKFGPEMPSGDTADWMEWASAHDWLKDAEMASQSPVEDVEGDEELKRFVPTGRRSQMVENQFGDWVRLADVVRKVEGILAVHERHVELLVEERIEAERDRDSRLTKEQCVEKLEALPVAYRRAGVGPPIPTIDRARALAAFKEEVPDA